jgi:hypothetical protein
MNWYIYQTNRCNFIEDFFVFKKFNYQLINLWDPELDYGHHFIPNDLLSSTNNVLIISVEVLSDLLSWSVSLQQIVNFINNNNHICVWNDLDALGTVNYNKKILIDLDSLIKKDRLHIFIDARLNDNHVLKQLQNINLIEIVHNRFMSPIRIASPGYEKNSSAKDFLLSSIKRKNRPHRQILWREISSRGDLINKGNVSHRTEKNRLLFNNDHFNTYNVDLYLNSWLEVVPETFYKNGYFFTEKICKPISAKTPFLIASSKGYLEYLKSLGFHTFSSLINEKYDQEHRVQDRIKLIVDQLEDIINNGSESFYHASRSILDHNYNLLAEISGKWQNETDLIIQQFINQIESD